MTRRWLRVLAYTGLLASLAACSVYDPDMLKPATSGSGGRSGGGAGEAGDASMPEACVPQEETCNDKDDDCDSIVDNEGPAGDDCSRRYHAKIPCNRGGLCLFIPSRVTCDTGWFHCDGLPDNGCESDKPCCVECDAGSDDGGSDDAGSVR